MRFNPLLSEDLEIDEKFEAKLINALWEAKRYSYLMKDEITDLADYIEQTTMPHLTENNQSK